MNIRQPYIGWLALFMWGVPLLMVPVLGEEITATKSLILVGWFLATLYIIAVAVETPASTAHEKHG